jgi:hypothetical protein
VPRSTLAFSDAVSFFLDGEKRPDNGRRPAERRRGRLRADEQIE